MQTVFASKTLKAN